MNKIIIIAVFIFWSAVSVFFANSLFSRNEQVLGQQPVNQPLNNLDAIEPSTLGIELASHNSQDNCWLTINAKIYDVTKYISSHPGGADEIIRYCGQDATQAFATMDKANSSGHSQTARDLLANYYIGEQNAVSAAGTKDPSSIDSAGSTANDANTNTNNAVVNTPKPTSLTLTSTVVSQHNTAGDCWVTAGNNVYNVTSYIRSHPGGQSNITKYCGKDIAAAFAGQGHSANASNIFASYKIGTIGTSVSSDVINTAPTNTSQNNTDNQVNGQRGDDDEEEDDD